MNLDISFCLFTASTVLVLFYGFLCFVNHLTIWGFLTSKRANAAHHLISLSSTKLHPQIHHSTNHHPSPKTHHHRNKLFILSTEIGNATISSSFPIKTPPYYPLYVILSLVNSPPPLSFSLLSVFFILYQNHDHPGTYHPISSMPIQESITPRPSPGHYTPYSTTFSFSRSPKISTTTHHQHALHAMTSLSPNQHLPSHSSPSSLGELLQNHS